MHFWTKLVVHLMLGYTLLVALENLPRTIFGSASPPMAWFPLALCLASQALIAWPKPRAFWYLTAAKLGYVYYYSRWVLPQAVAAHPIYVHTLVQAFILLVHAIGASGFMVLSDVKASVAPRP